MDKLLCMNFTVFIVLVYKTSLKFCEKLEIDKGYQEFCEHERFELTCGTDEVVVVTDAKYGRMDLGRCITEGYGYIGCYADALNVMDKKCSGRRTCTFKVEMLDADELEGGRCLPELSQYLRVSYSCIKVETSACQTCPTTSLAHITSQQGYISGGVLTEDHGNCSTQECPWFIEVEPGQKINLTLYDFGRAGQNNLSDICFIYAIIRERSAGDGKIVCSGSDRKRHVYTSTSNTLEIQFTNQEALGNMGQFLLYFEAIGCPHFKAGKNMWTEKNDTQLVVTCNYTKEVWILICVGTKWIGNVGTCLPEDPQETTDPETEEVSGEINYYLMKLGEINYFLKDAFESMTGGPFEARIKNLISDYFILRSANSNKSTGSRKQDSEALQKYITTCNHLSDEINSIEEIKTNLKSKSLRRYIEPKQEVMGTDQRILDIIISVQDFVHQRRLYISRGCKDISTTTQWKDVLEFFDPAQNESGGSQFFNNQTVLYKLRESLQIALTL